MSTFNGFPDLTLGEVQAGGFKTPRLTYYGNKTFQSGFASIRYHSPHPTHQLGYYRDYASVDDSDLELYRDQWDEKISPCRTCFRRPNENDREALRRANGADVRVPTKKFLVMLNDINDFNAKTLNGRSHFFVDAITADQAVNELGEDWDGASKVFVYQIPEASVYMREAWVRSDV